MTKHDHLNLLSRIDRTNAEAYKAGEKSLAEFTELRRLVRNEMERVIALADGSDTYAEFKSMVAETLNTPSEGFPESLDDMGEFIIGVLDDSGDEGIEVGDRFEVEATGDVFSVKCEYVTGCFGVCRIGWITDGEFKGNDGWDEDHRYTWHPEAFDGLRKLHANV